MPATTTSHVRQTFEGHPHRRQTVSSGSSNIVDGNTNNNNNANSSGSKDGHNSRFPVAGDSSATKNRDASSSLHLGLNTGHHANSITARSSNIRPTPTDYQHRYQQPPQRKHVRAGSLVVSSRPSNPTAPPESISHRPSSSSSLQSFSPPSRPYHPPPTAPSEYEPRSPQLNKRAPPASRSSNGVATSTGPPPALSTQRTYPADATRRNWNPADFAFAQQALSQTGLVGLGRSHRSSVSSSGSVSAERSGKNTGANDGRNRDPLDKAILPQHNVSRPVGDMNGRGGSRYGEDLLDDDRDRTLRALEGDFHLRREDGQTSQEVPTGEGNEDLFLNLARSNSKRGDAASRRRSRLPTYASNRQSLPPNSFSSPIVRPSQESDEADIPHLPQRSVDDSWQPQHSRVQSQSVSPTLQFRSLARDRVQLREETSRAGGLGLTPRPSNPNMRGMPNRAASPESNGNYQRRPSVPDTPAPRTPAYRQSNLAYTTSHMDSSPPVEHPIDAYDNDVNQVSARADGTESTASTTAPSTVWDELDDLKSRIRKLELTRKIPPSSGQAMSNASGDRPWTATTTVTTVSSSPKRGRGNSISPSRSTVLGSGMANVHPLLHAALDKTKDILNPEVYKALDATASDALSIAAALGSSGQPNSNAQSVVGSGSLSSLPSDRLLRRKADSMCRSLTELCIALSENRSDIMAPTMNHVQQNASPAGRERSSGLQHDARLDGAYDRPNGSGQDRNTLTNGSDRPSPRTFSRLEARRASMLGLNGGNSNGTSPRSHLDGSASAQASAQNPSRLGRSSTVLLRKRLGTMNDNDNIDESFRAPSRATTEVGYFRNSPREYAPRQPLPDRSSPAAQSSLPVRRHQVSASVPSAIPPVPSTSLNQRSTRTYLDPSTPPSYETDSNNSGKGMEARPDERRILPSIMQGGRLRTASLGMPVELPRRLRQPNADPLSHDGRYDR